MRSISSALSLAVLVAGLALAAGPARAEGDQRPAVARRAAETVQRLRSDLARVNAEVAALKRGERSVRNDYRLRERMADAEALAQKLTQAEASLRALTDGRDNASGGAPIVASPQASPQDGSVELEAKADLLADQARKLDGEATRLAKAADELRSRKALRRKAGSWERDPFAGLETSRRSLAAATPVAKTTSGTLGVDTNGRGAQTVGATAPPTVSVENGPTAGAGTAVAAPTPSVGSDSTTKTATTAAADGAGATKTSPLSATSADRQLVEQRLYLDPATAAELRHALGPGGAALEPDALDRGAVALRARARALAAEARALRARSLAP
jgi:hypothetical protein